jgi:hypothetical protein
VQLGHAQAPERHVDVTHVIEVRLHIEEILDQHLGHACALALV